MNWSGIERIDKQEGFELSLEKMIGLRHERRELDQQIEYHKRRGVSKVCSWVKKMNLFGMKNLFCRVFCVFFYV